MQQLVTARIHSWVPPSNTPPAPPHCARRHEVSFSRGNAMMQLQQISQLLRRLVKRWNIEVDMLDSVVAAATEQAHALLGCASCRESPASACACQHCRRWTLCLSAPRLLATCPLPCQPSCLLAAPHSSRLAAPYLPPVLQEPDICPLPAHQCGTSV